VSVEASGKNMRAVCQAKEVHDRTCRWGGKANQVHLAWFDIERLGWEEGDTICGLTLVGDDQMQTGRMRVSCDAEPDGDRKEVEEVEEVVDAVATHELQPAGPAYN
jgi:hypothetical protein